MSNKGSWMDLLNSDVSNRLGHCISRKSDIIELAQARWAWIKNKKDFTKEDALIDVLELLDSNSQYFDLTREEYDDIINNII